MKTIGRNTNQADLPCRRSQPWTISRASAPMSWFVAPNAGQIAFQAGIIAPPAPGISRNTTNAGSASTISVVSTRCETVWASMPVSSCSMMRLSRVQVSSVVSTNVLTASMANARIQPCPTPSGAKNRSRPSAKIAGGAPCGASLSVITVASASSASTASTSIAPRPTRLAELSLFSCFEVVPLASTAWKPLTAPQAIITHMAG